MKASILGIGTELTSGQIGNGNGQWISKRLQQLGVVTDCHLVVPDQQNLMLEALDFCAAQADLVFVTGGLGPTSDDFTREVIAKWSGKKLVYDESSWQHIEERLRPRGVPVQEAQKQQCYFPEGAKILTNTAGTANAFYLQHQGKDFFVLPGPPFEVAAVWQSFIHAWLEQKTRGLDMAMTWSWDCLGVPESEVARRAIAVLKDCPFEKAYRVHMPYVEFKLSFLRSQLSQAQSYSDQLDQAFADVTVLKNGRDFASELGLKLTDFNKIQICDSLSSGYLMHRIYPAWKSLFQQSKVVFLPNAAPASEVNAEKVLKLSLLPLADRRARATWWWKGQGRSCDFSSPYSSALLLEREHQYFTELALQFWLSQLAEL